MSTNGVIVAALLMVAAACGGSDTTGQTSPEIDTRLVTQGRTVAAFSGCTGCHSFDGAVIVGPSWRRLFGSVEELADGSSVVVDETYLRRAILDPEAEIVSGFGAGVMPQDYADVLSAEDVDALIALIESLG